MKLKAYANTDIGMKRKTNQDSFLSDDALGIFVVADGMGGHRGGEVASRLAVDVIRKFCSENKEMAGREMLDRAVNMSCREIYQHSKSNEELAGMGTTVVALLVQGDDVFVAHVGDSRGYLLCEDGIWQLTEDHSLLNEELRSGRLQEGQAASYQFRNVITRSVGYESHVQVDIYRRARRPGDRYFLCTDGLSGLVSIDEIATELRRAGSEQGLKNLIRLANNRGGDDNITALVCEIE